VNLDKGRLGEGPSSLIGSFLISYLALAATARSDQPEEARRHFWLYADEFHSFATLALGTMLSDLRKYRVGLVLAHQHLTQLDPVIRDAVFGNVGTIIAFRVGAADASYLASEFSPVFSPDDLIAVPQHDVYIRLLIDGAQSRAFSGTTLGPEDMIALRIGG
jgi:hypothetical protein